MTLRTSSDLDTGAIDDLYAPIYEFTVLSMSDDRPGFSATGGNTIEAITSSNGSNKNGIDSLREDEDWGALSELSSSTHGFATATNVEYIKR